MKKFHVWARPYSSGSATIVEMEDSATEAECEAACREALDDLIGNEFDTGFNEVSDEEVEELKKAGEV